MGHTSGVSVGRTGASLEGQVRSRVESLGYLPTTTAVAMKFIELGKNPQAEPGDYAKIICADGALSSKLLSLANSSWFGVRNKITSPVMAINLLGLGTVRTLAISYCLTGLHNDLGLSPEESKVFWAASLGKAIAARCYATRFDATLADEAFTAGLLQDFAMPVLYSIEKDMVLEWIEDAGLDWRGRLAGERSVFRLDHAEVGRLVAAKMDLPAVYVDAIAFHHSHEKLSEALSRPVLAEAVRLASLFPHCLSAWNRQDAEEVRVMLARSRSAGIEPDAFLELVNKEYALLCAYFEPAGGSRINMKELLKAATQEAADCTTRLVGTVHELMQQAIQAGNQVNQIIEEHSRLEEAAHRDPLTGALNREGLGIKAEAMLKKAARHGNGLAVIYLDLDRFKVLNDTCGHRWGDAALKAVVDSLCQQVRESDLVARMGGDEFVVILNDCGEENAQRVIERVLRQVAGLQLGETATKTRQMTLSAGMLWVPPGQDPVDLGELITAADSLMYDAKRAGGGRLCKGKHDGKEQAPADRGQ